MPPPPVRTWAATSSAVGWSWSRFGPIEPFVPAAASVWQLPQPASSNTFAPCATAAGGAALGAALSPPHADRARASASAAIRVAGALGTRSEYSGLEPESIPDFDPVEPERAADDR